MAILWVGMGGFLGAIARYGVYLLVRSSLSGTFPLATLLINLVGCFFAGILAFLIERMIPFHKHLFLLGSMGFLGSFTTFSAFGVETFFLFRSGYIGWTTLNIMGQLLVGLIGVWVGYIVAGKFYHLL